MDADGPISAEPRLRSVRSELLPAGITGKELSNLEDGWGPLLEPFPWSGAQATGLMLRGRLLFGLGARLLGARSSDAEEAGALWSLIDGMDHCSDPSSRAYLRAKAREISLPARAPRTVRPLTILTALSILTLDDPSTGLSRGAGAIWHRLTGRYPKRRAPSANGATWPSNDRSDP